MTQSVRATPPPRFSQVCGHAAVQVGGVAGLHEVARGALLWWNVAVANLLAAVSMLIYFFLGHRSLGARLLERWTED